ncbi:hypothetical protein [Streptomyces sp. NPDC047928]|uniref:hypothetical protein n=1 Tax=unclassified Streptomyces TaxID=2593676 RepID=UPI00371875ED
MRRAHSATIAATLTAVLAGPAVWLGAATGAAAHGDTLSVDITGHAFGKVRTTITWENDDDPVDGRVAATVNAVNGDGTVALGPWKLVRDPGTAADWTTAEALPPGRWTVVVATGYPALGRAEEEITVSPGTPASSPPGTPPDPARGPSRTPATPPDPGPATPPAASPAGGAPSSAPPPSAAASPAAGTDGTDTDGSRGEGPGTLVLVGGGVLLVGAAAVGAAVFGVVRRRRR